MLQIQWLLLSGLSGVSGPPSFPVQDRESFKHRQQGLKTRHYVYMMRLARSSGSAEEASLGPLWKRRK